MRITDFTREYLEPAYGLAWDNYIEEKLKLPVLLGDAQLPSLEYFADNGLGVAAVEGDKLLGFLGVCEPWEGAFDTLDSLGVFSPLHAHASVKENRARIYQDMYEYGAKKWAEKNIIGVGNIPTAW